MTLHPQPCIRLCCRPLHIRPARVASMAAQFALVTVLAFATAAPPTVHIEYPHHQETK